MKKDLSKLEKLWWDRNPAHQVTIDGSDRFWETVHLIFEEYSTYLELSEEDKNNAKKDEIEHILIDLWSSIGMDTPDNFEDIVQFCYEDVCDTADKTSWSSMDVTIAFRRWIETN